MAEGMENGGRKCGCCRGAAKEREKQDMRGKREEGTRRKNYNVKGRIEASVLTSHHQSSSLKINSSSTFIISSNSSSHKRAITAGLLRKANTANKVYKRYKLYCQQMQSVVTSFESVASLGNAAPFLCFVVRAMFRQFQCLKNAILDQIRVTSKAFGNVDARRYSTPSSCSDDKGLTSNFLQHPVWRSQRGFPDKTVIVLRNWLFNLTDSDKQMLAEKTGLSRSQVSNWITSARVRLWKSLVDEMHALERLKLFASKQENPKLHCAAAQSEDDPETETGYPESYHFELKVNRRIQSSIVQQLTVKMILKQKRDIQKQITLNFRMTRN
ncbi:BEL1-like homeodomain protein 8 [Spinacia oleracea]|uniref:BEL1-like homeodomain protein 8 n=1 Tax=Spinacia oleracea TaxID=3562 RepID=A0A9R0IR29_SPIOL|nr:BEL1-like homeodomain protein 8 [Spinacia oleracea]